MGVLFGGKKLGEKKLRGKKFGGKKLRENLDPSHFFRLHRKIEKWQNHTFLTSKYLKTRKIFEPSHFLSH